MAFGFVQGQLERLDATGDQRVRDRLSPLLVEVAGDRDDPSGNDSVRDCRSAAAQVGLAIMDGSYA
jgi:hypothetical protein